MPFWQYLQSLLSSTSPTLLDELQFRLSNLTWLEGLDLLLVTLAFYVSLRLVLRSRVSMLLRGQLILMIILFAAIVLLPLPTFDSLLLGLLFAVLVATPTIFQPELRRFLERIGRNAGLTRGVRQTATENMLPRLVRAVETMATSHTGALVALEGKRALQEVIETGVSIEGQISSELLQALFYPENPLHDGAVVLRDDRVVAASCVLPLTERPIPTRRRLGTRHRAAVGLSESSDALVIVVSEETGTISVARDGVLHRPLDGAMLREQLYDFYEADSSVLPNISFRAIIQQTGRFLRRGWTNGKAQSQSQYAADSHLSKVGLFFLSFLLALVAWVFVTERTNPARQVLFDNIPLRVESMPSGMTVTTTAPSTVTAMIQSTDRVLSNLRPSSFQAVVSLDKLAPGLHSLPVKVNTGTPQVRVLSVEPATLDVELAPIITKTMEVTIKIPDQDNLSPAYRIVSQPTVTPTQVQISGAAPLVEQINRLQTDITVSNANTSFKRTRPLQALDEAGNLINGVNLSPEQVEVSVAIEPQLNARNVGVRPITTGLPPEGYRLSGLNVTPPDLTLQGNPVQLAQVGAFVNTLPVDVSEATGDMNLQVPLDLSANIQALDSNGDPLRTVTVQVQIVPRNSYILVTRPVELLGITNDITATVTPSSVDLVLTGPAPILNQIQTTPKLVQVTVDVVGIDPPRTISQKLTVIAPEEIQIQAIPDTVQVDLQP